MKRVSGQTYRMGHSIEGMRTIARVQECVSR